MTSHFDAYFQALKNRDIEAYLAYFTPDAKVHDPYGARPFLGTEGLHKFMDGFERTWASFNITPGQSFAAGDRVAVSWQTEAARKQGKTAVSAGSEWHTLAEDGRISHPEGLEECKRMAAQK